MSFLVQFTNIQKNNINYLLNACLFFKKNNYIEIRIKEILILFIQIQYLI